MGLIRLPRLSVYSTYTVILFMLNFLIFATPLLARSGSGYNTLLYSAFSSICHQSTVRSLCLYADGIGECMPQTGGFSGSKEITVERPDGSVGYKFPVCARDMAIYATMFVGGLILPFLTDKKRKQIPTLLILMLAAAPTGIDGITQMLGWRESTNPVRIITGAVLGLAIPFFLIPTANVLVGKIGKKSGSRGAKRQR